MTKSAKLTTVALSVFRLNGLLIEWGNTFAGPHGLTSARWQVLGAISLAPEAPNIRRSPTRWASRGRRC